MNTYFIVINFLLLLFLFFLGKKRKVWIQPSVHFLLINIISVFVCNYWVEEFQHIKNTMQTELFYIGLYVCSLLSLVIIRKSAADHQTEQENSPVRQMKFLQHIGVVKWISFLGLFNFLFLIYFLLSIQTDVLFLNYNYLDMTRVDKLGIANNNILILYQRFLVINGVFSLFVFGLLNISNYAIAKISKWLFLTIGLFFWVYQLGNNSRSAALILIGLVVPILLLDPKSVKRSFKLTSLILLIIMSYQSSLKGRNRLKQGISQIPSNFIETFKVDTKAYAFYAENIFGGAWVFSEAKGMRGDYPDPYKYLSFSPLPSSIDHFNQYIKYQNRISLYEPYSANVEVFHFGGIYIILYFLILTFGLRILNKAVKKSEFLGLLMCLPAYLFFIGYQQYPLRSNLRFFYLSVLICYIFIKWNQSRNNKKVKEI